MKISKLLLVILMCSPQVFASSRKYEEHDLSDEEQAKLVQEKCSKYADKNENKEEGKNCIQRCCAWFSSLIVDIAKAEKRIKDSNEYIKFHGLTSQNFTSDECLNKK